jgi:hypothetical protein
MQREAKAYLWDIADAAESIRSFTDGKDLNAYLNDEMLRAAVERKFGIVGEALAQLLRYFPDYRENYAGWRNRCFSQPDCPRLCYGARRHRVGDCPRLPAQAASRGC